MQLLVLGGTRFVGRHLIEDALARGHDVTMFNRGQTDPDLFPEVELIKGDRESDIDKLEGRSWDAVIDTCGYVPRVVELSAHALAGSGRYLFVSTISVYSDMSTGNREDSPVSDPVDQETEEVTGQTYGPLKAACEQVVQSVLGSRATIVRPGLIVGPHDSTDRFTYWPVRIAEGGQVVAPLPKDAPVQFIDVRDLSAFMLKLVEGTLGGTFNTVGPKDPISLGQLIDACIEASPNPVDVRWIEPETLLEMNVDPSGHGRANSYTIGLPMWVPNKSFYGVNQTDNSKSMESGLKLRTMDETIRDTLTWARTRPLEYVMQAGLTAEQEREVLSRVGTAVN